MLDKLTQDFIRKNFGDDAERVIKQFSSSNGGSANSISGAMVSGNINIKTPSYNIEGQTFSAKKDILIEATEFNCKNSALSGKELKLINVCKLTSENCFFNGEPLENFYNYNPELCGESHDEL